MPRAIHLKPAFREARKRAGLSPWIVNVPAFLSPTGKRQELFYSTKTEAQGKCDQLQATKDNFGTSLSLLSSTQITTAAKAFQMLEPHNIDLLDAVGKYLEIHKRRTESITFLELCNRYIEVKSGRDERHLKGLRNTRDRFPPLHAMLVSDIDYRVLEPLVNRISAGGRNLVMRHLRAFWNFGVKKGFATDNPVSRLDFVQIVRKEVEVITPTNVAKMMQHALQDDLGLVPFLTLGFFTGIRPEEIRLMHWGDIDIPTKGITIRPEVSKTHKRRFPELSDNALAWLESYRNAGGRMQGPT